MTVRVLVVASSIEFLVHRGCDLNRFDHARHDDAESKEVDWLESRSGSSWDLRDTAAEVRKVKVEVRGTKLQIGLRPPHLHCRFAFISRRLVRAR
ncbi:hypothetical protein [Sinorhizobium americanum]|uniref:hypothetical protein n=1 Tax=Sinorhizobium americanum TaxID=194963 RepID=UPI00137B6CEF|nr:hypothetical protein [Sinorhizobium americanum]